VVTIHDLQFRHHPEDFSRAELVALRALVWLSCARADHVLTAATASAEEIVGFGGLSAERLTVVPYGVSGDFFEPIDPARAAESLRRTGVTPPFLLTVAHSYPHKNLARLVRAFARLDGDIPHQLVIVGRPRRGEPALREACRALVNPRRVLRPSGLSRDALRALYQTADLCVFPTLFEGFGLPVLEAMASDTPVACSDIPVLREVAGGAAEFFAPHDEAAIAEAIRGLLGDDARRVVLRRRGAARAREFTWERTARGTREAFAKAMASRR
jgi:glycosyltransferase involved in cell wall biosynthesis